MAEGMLAILGLIESKETYDWLQLYAEKNEVSYNELQKVKTIYSHGLKDPIIAKPLKWGKYRKIEKLQYLIEKVSVIQGFYKERVKGRKIESK